MSVGQLPNPDLLHYWGAVLQLIVLALGEPGCKSIQSRLIWIKGQPCLMLDKLLGVLWKSCHLSSARDGMVSAKLQDQLPGRCWVLLGSPPDASYQMPSMSGRPSLGCSTKSTIICFNTRRILMKFYVFNLVGLAPVTRFRSLILLELFKAKMKYETLPDLRERRTTGPSWKRNLLRTGKTLSRKFPPLNKDKAKAAWKVLFQKPLPPNVTNMTREAQIQGPGDSVFLVAGDFESSLPFIPGLGLAHGGCSTNVSSVRRMSESYGMKAHLGISLHLEKGLLRRWFI